MNKLLKEFLSYIITEERVKREVGAIWQTPSKKWSAKRADRTQGGFASREAAQAWLSGKSKAPGEETPSGEKPEKLPPEVTTGLTGGPGSSTATGLLVGTGKRESEKTQSGFEMFNEPIVTPNNNKVLGVLSPERFKSVIQKIVDKIVKDVPLPEMDRESYISRGIVDDDGKPEDDIAFTTRMEREGYAVRKPFVPIDSTVRTQLRDAGVPEHHIQVIERAANVIRKGDKPPISLITRGAAGAGTNSSQVGELTALALMALPADQRQGAIDALEAMTPRTGNILDREWIQAAGRQAEAFHASMDARYGAGNWSVETTAWDTPSDISSIGLSEEDKGFSTDVVVRIKVNGESRAARISLKKDGNVYVLNGAANDINLYALQTLQPDERKEYDELSALRRKLTSGNKEEKASAREELRQKGITPSKDAIDEKLKEIEQKAFERLPPKTQQAIRIIKDYPERQQVSCDKMAAVVGKPMTPKQLKSAVETVKKNNPSWKPNDVDFAIRAHTVISRVNPPRTPEKVRKALLDAKVIDSSSDNFRKAVLYASELEATRSSEMTGLLDQHYEITAEAERAYFDGLLSSDKLMDGLMIELERQFPLRVISSGTESMMVGGVPVDDETLAGVLGTSDPTQIRGGLTMVERDGRRLLIYTAANADGSKREVPIATVECRERGQGYRGNMTVGYQMAPQFECAAAKANQERNKSKNPPISNPANDKIANSKKCSSV